jgi:hypothetical protein
MCLLYGAGRFIRLLAVYAQSVGGCPSVISGALIPAVRDVYGCRACNGFWFPGYLFVVQV